MELVDNLTKEEYVKFFHKCKYNHFLQSYAWGETCRKRKQSPIYLGLKDDKGKLVGACLALRRNTPFGMCYFYAPRGFIVDYSNLELVEKFTEELKKYIKKQNAIYFKMDPGIVYQEIDEDAKPIEGGKNNYELFKKLIDLGYIHGGFSTLFTKNQPRYTFRINTKRPLEDIENSMNKTYLKTIKRSYNYDLEISNDYDNETFYNLMKDIANKDNFNGNSKEFFDAHNKSFSSEDSITYITIKIYPDKEIKKAEEELNKIKKDVEEGKIPQKRMADTNNIIARYEKDIEVFKPYEGKYPDGLVSLVLICPHTDRAMWTLYIGNNSLATHTFAVNRSYYEAIKYAEEHDYEFLDLFGTCGEPHTKEKNYAGIHEYKRKMGGTYTEFMGEFDLVNKKFWYKVLPTLLKIYRKIKR